MLALTNTRGRHGDTKVYAGIFVSSQGRNSSWAPNDVKIVDGVNFVRLTCTERGLAKYVGADMKRPHSLDHNPFLQTLRNARNDAVAHEMKAAQNAKTDLDMLLCPKEFPLIGKISRIISVFVQGFNHSGEFVPPMTIKMLSTAFKDECPYVEVDPQTLEFVRRGMGATLHVEVYKRAKVDRFFDGLPNARLHPWRNLVYTRFRNADGKWSQKTITFEKSNDNDVQEKHILEAAQRAQTHYVASHYDFVGDDIADTYQTDGWAGIYEDVEDDVASSVP